MDGWIDQLVSQSISQSLTQSVSQSINQSIDRSVTFHSIIQSINELEICKDEKIKLSDYHLGKFESFTQW